VANIVSIHSFRGGTGKSNTTANLAALLTMQGQRVGVIDSDIQSPGIHILFGLEGDKIKSSLNDYLWHKCAIKDAALDVTAAVGANVKGKVFLVPSSSKPGEITRVLREGYDAQMLTGGLRQLVTDLALDTLLIDTHPGLNEETLLSLVISRVLFIVLRPDQQDYEGTGVTVRVARELRVPKMMLVVNKTPPSLEPAAVKMKVEQAYGCPVAAVMPHSNEMMDLASGGLFVARYPNHPMTALYQQIASEIAT
jgi:MinD-like ATPase involved in chromosome partitioning or flagellar assembly